MTRLGPKVDVPRWPCGATSSIVAVSFEELLATHYCLTGNQPRMRAVAGEDANVVSFEFKDATNLPNQSAPHMGGVRFTMMDADHHTEEWSVVANGRTVIRKFDCRRKQ